MKKIFLFSFMVLLFGISCKKVNEGREVADKFLTYIQNEDYNSAYDLCTKDFHDAVSIDELKDYYQNKFDSYGKMQNFKMTAFKINTKNGTTYTKLTYRVVYYNQVLSDTIFLKKDDGEMKIFYVYQFVEHKKIKNIFRIIYSLPPKLKIYKFEQN